MAHGQVAPGSNACASLQTFISSITPSRLFCWYGLDSLYEFPVRTLDVLLPNTQYMLACIRVEVSHASLCRYDEH
eukprot:3693522-Pyramimonas_sp.AAC.1